MSELIVQDIAKAQDSAQAAIKNAGAVAAVVLHKDLAVQDVESRGLNRTRFRGTFDTTSLDDFTDYTKTRSQDARNVGDTIQGFINTKNGLSCHVFFNLGGPISPGHADDKAILTMQPTPEYQHVVGMAPRKMSQRDFVAFVEDWRDFITPIVVDDEDESEPLRIRATLNALRNMKISATSESNSSVSDVGQSTSSLDAIAAKSIDTLPTHFILKTCGYEGLDQREIAMRLIISTDDHKPAFTLSPVGHATVIEQMAQNFKSKIVDGLGDVGTFLIGSFKP